MQFPRKNTNPGRKEPWPQAPEEFPKLRFNPCQYKKYPRRPGLFYNKPFVVRLFCFPTDVYFWFAGFNKAGKILMTEDKNKAVRVSAEQAGYLSEKGTVYRDWEMTTGSYERHHEYIDPRRLKSSPNRLHPLTIREFLMVRLLGIKLRVDMNWDWGKLKVARWKQFTEMLHGRRLYGANYIPGGGNHYVKRTILGAIQPVKDMLKWDQKIWAKHAGQKAVGQAIKDHATDEE